MLPNAGLGRDFSFHGAFASRATAVDKGHQVRGSFILERQVRGARRYIVMTRNPYRVTAFARAVGPRGKVRDYGYHVLGPYDSPTRLPRTGSFDFPHLQAAKYFASREFLDPRVHQVAIKTHQDKDVARLYRRTRAYPGPTGRLMLHRPAGNPQRTFDPFDYGGSPEAAKVERDAAYRELKARGIIARRSVLRGQLEKYGEAHGAPGRGVRDVYMLTWRDNPRPVDGSGTPLSPDAKLATLRRIVEHRQTMRLGREGSVDLFTASVILQVYEHLSPKNQQRYLAMPLWKMADVAFHLLHQRNIAGVAGFPFYEGVQACRRDILKRALIESGGQRTLAARRLGLQRTYLLKMIRHYGLAAEVPPGRPGGGARYRMNPFPTASPWGGLVLLGGLGLLLWGLSQKPRGGIDTGPSSATVWYSDPAGGGTGQLVVGTAPPGAMPPWREASQTEIENAIAATAPGGSLSVLP